MCHDGILCPIVNGEPLALCGRTCYSKYVYTCRDGTELLIRPLMQHGRIFLRAENPQDVSSPPASSHPIPGGGPGPAAVIGVDGQLMTACRLAWNVGGITCSYCPVPQVDPTRCPEGNVTALSAATNAMDVVVPGGQHFFLTEGWTVGYTQAHSMLMPNGSTVAGFWAFEGGGYFNVLDGAWGWAACGQGEQRVLHVRNSTNANELRGCVGINLNILPFEDDAGAWQYS